MLRYGWTGRKKKGKEGEVEIEDRRGRQKNEGGLGEDEGNGDCCYMNVCDYECYVKKKKGK